MSSLLDALTRGWYTGWSEAPELVAGGTGLLERLIPGEQQGLTSFEDRMNKYAEDVRAKGPEGESQGFLEKLVEGVGAAPGTVATMLPFIGGAAAAPIGAIAGGALGFGAHSLVRHGDEGLPQAFGYGLKGAAEGALFGGIGKFAGKLGVSPAAAELIEKQRALKLGGDAGKAAAKSMQPEIDSLVNTFGKQLYRKGAHGGLTGTAVGGMGLAHGQPLEDAAAGGATMGLLGLMGSGKYKEPLATRDQNLASIRSEAEKWAAERPKVEPPKDAVQVPSQPGIIAGRRQAGIEPTGAVPDRVTPETAPVSPFIKNHRGVEWVDINDIDLIKEANRRVDHSITRNSPAVVSDLTKRFRGGEPLLEPLEVEYNTADGRVFLGQGNHRLAALQDAGWTHVPVIVRRTNLHGFGKKFAPPKVSPAEGSGWVLPSQLGFNTPKKPASAISGIGGGNITPPPGEPPQGTPPPTGGALAPTGGIILEDFVAAGTRAKPYERQTAAGKVKYYDVQDHLNDVITERTWERRTNDNTTTRAAQSIATDEHGNIYTTASNIDAAGIVLGERVNARGREAARLRQEQAAARSQGKLGDAERLEMEINDLEANGISDLLRLRGYESSIGNALRILGLTKRNTPEWKQAFDQLAKKGIMDKESGGFRQDIKELLQLSEGNPLLQTKIAKALDTPTLFDKMQEYWINGLLSGPPTHMVNITSNALFAGVDMLEKRISTKAEAANKVITREQAALENATDIRTTWNAIPKAWKVFLEIAKMGEDKKLPASLEFAEKYRGGQTKIDYNSKAIGGTTGKVVRFPSKMLQAMDVAFKVLAGDRYGTQQALRMAYKDAKAGKIENNNKAISAKAEEYLGNGGGMEPAKEVLAAMQSGAKRLTYTENISGFGQKIISARDVEVNLPGIGPVKPLVGILPFVSTPYNVIRQSVARSPLGVLRLKGLKQQYETGKISSADYYREVTATALGSSVLVGLAGMAKAGLITGGGPVNQQDRQNLIATGWRPYSVRIPGQGYLSLQRIEPLGTILGMAGDIAEFGDSEDKVGKAMATVKDNITDKSFLYGLESLAKAWANPEQFGATYYKQMAGSVVPTIVAKAQQAADPYARQVEAGEARVGVPDAIAYRIPGLSQELRQRTTPFGEKQERWGTLGTDTATQRALGAVQSFTSVAPVSLTRENTMVESEFARLGGFEGMPPGMPKKSKTLRIRGTAGEDVKLTDDEYAIYDRYHAQAKEHLNRVISSPAYQSIQDPASQADLLRSIYRKYRSAANQEVNYTLQRRVMFGK